MGIFDWRNPKNRKRNRTITVECNPNEVRINGIEISFPTNYGELIGVLGEASRIEPIKQTNNKVYLWDEHGIYCSTNDPEKMLMVLFVEDNRYGLGHQPKQNYTGAILIDGAPIETNIDNVGLDRPYMLRSIIKDDKQIAVALGWNPSV
jgi:hypothetical protein